MSSNRKEHTLVYSSSLGRQDRNVAVFLSYGTIEQLVSCSPNSASSNRKEHTLVYSSSLGRQDIILDYIPRIYSPEGCTRINRFPFFRQKSFVVETHSEARTIPGRKVPFAVSVFA
ncbi:hypothetical protein CEXT_317221 [Caerostris extrusa]|uniref:Uncharacterized protein n=1 Tax=Caerostris extrusa TaxID=172846 RepID=A0AAV4P6M1_CAEEX|nr:hypothetical protein CEXT_317221 [Caerostris extrusa]